MSMRYYLGIDLGGTNARAAVVDVARVAHCPVDPRARRITTLAADKRKCGSGCGASASS